MMASPRRRAREAREAFFKDLDNLDSLGDSDGDGDERHKSFPLSPSQQVTVDTALKSVEKRSLSKTPARIVGLTRSTIDPTVDLGTSLATRSPSEKSRSPPATLRRARSAGPAVSRSNKRQAKGIGDPQARDRAGLFNATYVFFFIPNHNKPKIRELRINKAISGGATWARKYGASITHVVVKQGLTYASAIKEESIPAEGPASTIAIVTEDWLVECYSRNQIVDFRQERFYLMDMNSAYATQSPSKHGRRHSPPISSSTSVPSSVAAKRSSHKKRSKQPDTTPKKHRASYADTEKRPSPCKITEGLSSDDLDDIIRDIRAHGTTKAENLLSNDPSFDIQGDYDAETDEAAGQTTWQCMSKNELGHTGQGPNAATISLLNKMAEFYTSGKDTDQFRAMAFRKAVSTLKKATAKVETKEAALDLKISKGLAEKIEEIARTGRLGRLEETLNDPIQGTLKLFTGIYGVGYKQARAWIAAGYSTLEQLSQSAQLNDNQKIGIERYDDLQKRIPRDEVTQHGLVVEKALHAIDADLIMVIGGSYRRKSPDSGDIDIMVSKRDAELGYLQTTVLANLVPKLSDEGFIVAELAAGRFGGPAETSSKWMGCCCLPHVGIWRRLDLLLVPWSELGAALIYWTGNDIFNRSLRLKARKMGMRLNQKGLYKDVLRKQGQVRDTVGELVAARSEKDIFAHLGVAYRPPEHRNP
jgi:DNA polymerase IV